jgi:hypothetical protein
LGWPLAKRELAWLKENKAFKQSFLREGPLAILWVEGMEYLNAPMKNHAIPAKPERDTCLDHLMRQMSLVRDNGTLCRWTRENRNGPGVSLSENRLSADVQIIKIRKLRPGSIERSSDLGLWKDCAKAVKKCLPNQEKSLGGSGGLHFAQP